MDKVNLIATDSNQPTDVGKVTTVDHVVITKQKSGGCCKTASVVILAILTCLLLASTITLSVLVFSSYSTYGAFDFYGDDYNDDYGTINNIKTEIRNLKNSGGDQDTLNNIYNQLTEKFNDGSYCTSGSTPTTQKSLIDDYQWSGLASSIYASCMFQDYVDGGCIQEKFMADYNANHATIY